MIGLIGISYKTASIDIREKFSISQDEIIPFAEYLQKETGIKDLVVLSTCNRTEIYFSQKIHDRFSVFLMIYKTLERYKEIDEEYLSFFYHSDGYDTAHHLFSVAAGLDSMVLGEDQIIGQIKEAYLYCTEANLTNAVLMRLFQKAFEAGKRARTETNIKWGSTSVSSTAVDLCLQELGSISEKSALVIGAGDTGTLALQNLVKKDIGSSAVINRTQENAEILARRFNTVSHSYLKLQSQLSQHDIIIVATKAPHFIITKKMVLTFQKDHPRKQIYIDLSVPRNIDESIDEIANVTLFALDDIQKVIDANTEKRQESVLKVSQIVQEVADDLNEWMVARSLRPAIHSIANNLQKIHKSELEKFRNIDSPELKDAVSNFTNHLTQRYSRLLIKNLKELTNNGKNTECLNFVNVLFSMDERSE